MVITSYQKTLNRHVVTACGIHLSVCLSLSVGCFCCTADFSKSCCITGCMYTLVLSSTIVTYAAVSVLLLLCSTVLCVCTVHKPVTGLEFCSLLLRYYIIVCVCVFSSHPFWTSSSLDVPAGVTQEEGHTGFLIHLPSAVRALIFVARRIQPFLSLVDREVEFCVLTN